MRLASVLLSLSARPTASCRSTTERRPVLRRRDRATLRYLGIAAVAVADVAVVAVGVSERVPTVPRPVNRAVLSEGKMPLTTSPFTSSCTLLT